MEAIGFVDGEKARRKMSSQLRHSLSNLGPIPALVLLLCGVAAAQDIKTNYMPGTNFAQFHTYKWVTIEGAQHPNQIVDAEIKQAIDAQLATKGFTKVTADPADMYVGYQTSVSQQRQWNAYGMGGGWRFGGGMASATSSTIDIGTIVVDMYNPAAKQLIWTGSATKSLDPSKSPEKNQQNLDKAMQKLLKNFPPK
jgi:hypothetical protein